MYVYEEDGRIAGLVRVERERSATSGRSWSSTRSGWPTPATSAIGSSSSSCARARKRGAARFHVACADTDGNVELLMQAGFMRYGEERILARPARPAAAGARGPTSARRRPGSGPRRRIDALALSRLYAAATPAPVARLEAIRLADWERQGGHWRVPRSSLAPILRFADVEAFVQEAPGGGRDGTELAGFVQVGVAKEDQPHYLKVIARPDADASALVGFGLGVIAAAHRPRAPSGARTTGSSRPCEPTSRRSTGAWRTPASTRSPA